MEAIIFAVIVLVCLLVLGLMAAFLRMVKGYFDSIQDSLKQIEEMAQVKKKMNLRRGLA